MVLAYCKAVSSLALHLLDGWLYDDVDSSVAGSWSCNSSSGAGLGLRAQSAIAIITRNAQCPREIA